MNRHRVIAAALAAAICVTRPATGQNPQFESAMRALTATPLAEGTFSAIASPWVDTAMKRTDLARFTGKVVALGHIVAYQLYLCDENGLRWQTMVQFFVKDGQEKKSPFDLDLTLPSMEAAITANGRGMLLGGPTPTGGSAKVTIDPMKSVRGILHLKYARARLPYATASELVEMGVSFKAKVTQDAAGIAAACAPPGR